LNKSIRRSLVGVSVAAPIAALAALVPGNAAVAGRHNKSGVVTYARTSHWTSVSIAPGATSSTQFTVPSSTPAGRSTLVVVANGIASQPVGVTIR